MATHPSHPPPYILSPTNTHQNTIIALHGTSQTGPAFADQLLTHAFPPPNPSTPSLTPISPRIPTQHSSPSEHEKTTLPLQFSSTKFIFPTGAPKPTTVFYGQESHAWFDVHSFSDRTIGEADSILGLRESVLYLAELVRDEVQVLEELEGKGKGKVVLLGFSQGCAVVAMMLLSGEVERLWVRKGCVFFVGMSGWLPFRVQIEGVVDRSSESGLGLREKRRKVREFVRELLGLEPWDPDAEADGRLDVKTWLEHGEEDEKMKMLWGTQMREVLLGLGMDVCWTAYKGLGHWWCEEELRHVASILQGILSQKSTA